MGARVTRTLIIDESVTFLSTVKLTRIGTQTHNQ